MIKNLKNFKTKKSFIQRSTIKGLLIGHGKAGQKVAPGPVQWPFNCFFIVLLCPAGGGRRANVPKKALNQTAPQSLDRDRPLLNKPNFNWSPTGGSTKKFCTWMARLQWVFSSEAQCPSPFHNNVTGVGAAAKSYGGSTAGSWRFGVWPAHTLTVLCAMSTKLFGAPNQVNNWRHLYLQIAMPTSVSRNVLGMFFLSFIFEFHLFIENNSFA